MSMQYDVLIFDWDGTLMNSAEHISQCLCTAFDDLGLTPPTLDAAKNIIGLGMVEAIQELRPGLENELIAKIRERYAYHFFCKPIVRDDLFEGALEALDLAARAGYKLAIATGKSRPGMEVALKQLDMGRYFHVVRCADETRSKPHPLMLEEILRHFQVPADRALMIGDTEYDMKMARAIHMDRLAVSYGVHSRERLMLHEPIDCIDAIRHLQAVLENRLSA